MGPQTISAYESVASQIMRTNCVGFASFTILIWDHVDTFKEEVEYIWKGEKRFVSYLFLLNRYLTPLGFIVNLFAYLSPVWTEVKSCKHFVRFEGSMTVIGINIAALMMLIRIYALYRMKQWIVRCVALLLLIEVITNCWLLSTGKPALRCWYPGLHSCTMVFDEHTSKVLASSSAWLPLLYDTVATALILFHTFPSIREKDTMHIMRTLLEDGLIYYVVILTVTLVLTLMIILAPDGLQNIAAQLELTITVTMMSRITLSLKKAMRKEPRNYELPEIFLGSLGPHGASSFPLNPLPVAVVHVTNPNTVQ